MTTFLELGASAELADNLRQQGITEAFPIQAQTIPPALDGKDVCGRAPAGSGKTIAFGVPLVAASQHAKPRKPQGLVLTPTRQLATQVAADLRGLSPRCRIGTFFGGTGYAGQIRTLRRGVDIAVACPGRLNDLLYQGEVNLQEVQIVVVDEADGMADMGFLPQIRQILDQTSKTRQTLLFSATPDSGVDTLIQHYQTNPERIEAVNPETDGIRVAHSFISVAPHEKRHRTATLAAMHESVVAFCRTKRSADRLASSLSHAGAAVAYIHGDRTQRQREKALDAFRLGEVSILVATDVAARGIHFDDVSCVIHYDLASDSKDYIHRSGRTGRAGTAGAVISLVSKEDKGQLAELRKHLNLPVVHYDPALREEAGFEAATTPSATHQSKRDHHSRLRRRVSRHR